KSEGSGPDRCCRRRMRPRWRRRSGAGQDRRTLQFHLDGFRPGDPAVHPAVDSRSGDSSAETDVLIVGTGPAGLILAAQLAAFPDISVRIVERRERPLEL